ncbi:L-serine ammonia-lyase, iron-sulfur-dependent, subunit alpha [uncultured Catenibacterium sp.]|uniref:L-serine ammonia-lyase, iron-sulfur-dependent, subunit alpha n=1 Tax=uncultured Catenibacterium sp. TaxID=286142 RepID=UPI0025970672|nr:L-serine ammonia-lyase, iron-sulfur-dependent, subunit alpha [uncultured Catenibacterium sp.]
MQSLRELYKIGIGPSSSHTYGPMKIAERIKSLYPDMEKVHVDLYGSLSLTGKGHLTDKIMQQTFAPVPCDFSFKSGELPYHPNGMLVTVYCGGEALKPIEAYSIGGGEIYFKGDLEEEKVEIYPHHTMREVIDYCENEGLSLYDYVLRFEDENFKEYLFEVLEAMFTCVENGLHTQGILQGSLQLKRVAGSMYQQALNTHHEMAQERLFIASYAYAVSEENADGHMIVTAPTCGASGVLPAILYYAHHQMGLKKRDLVKALAIGGLYGNTVKYNATIAGADGGCQAEVGTACAMASASMAWINELNNSLIDYAAEMGLEHNLGLTCDPVGGYVQIPCIERNALAALRAYDAAMLAGQLGYVRKNKVPFDTVVRVMKETGKDLNVAYKETSLGGLAKELK